MVSYDLSLGILLYILKGMESQALDVPHMKMWTSALICPPMCGFFPPTKDPFKSSSRAQGLMLAYSAAAAYSG